MADNAAVITELYEAFQRQDGAAMGACYHPEARFSDPVFPELKGPEVPAMWTMLCERAKGFSLEFSGVSAEGNHGRAHWEARYIFSTTNRPVHNIIDAAFEFHADGRILRHVDTFDMWRWSRQALGVTGVLLGWSSVVRNKVQVTAGASLRKYMQSASD